MRACRRPFFPVLFTPTPASGLVTRQYAHVVEAAVLPSRLAQAWSVRGAGCVSLSCRQPGSASPGAAQSVSDFQFPFLFNHLAGFSSAFPQACHQKMWISAAERTWTLPGPARHFACLQKCRKGKRQSNQGLISLVQRLSTALPPKHVDSDHQAIVEAAFIPFRQRRHVVGRVLPMVEAEMKSCLESMP